MCNLLGYDKFPPKIQHYRLKKKDAAAGLIILKFESEVLKDDFFMRFLRIAKTMTLDKLLTGAKADRVFISQDLCKSQYDIYKLAVKMKKDAEVFQVRFASGYTMVKLDEESPFKRFHSTAMLNDAIQN